MHREPRAAIWSPSATALRSAGEMAPPQPDEGQPAHDAPTRPGSGRQDRWSSKPERRLAHVGLLGGGSWTAPGAPCSTVRGRRYWTVTGPCRGPSRLDGTAPRLASAPRRKDHDGRLRLGRHGGTPVAQSRSMSGSFQVLSKNAFSGRRGGTAPRTVPSRRSGPSSTPCPPAPAARSRCPPNRRRSSAAPACWTRGSTAACRGSARASRGRRPSPTSRA